MLKLFFSFLFTKMSLFTALIMIIWIKEDMGCSPHERIGIHMIGLGKWQTYVNTMVFKGDVTVVIADKDGEYDIDFQLPDKFKDMKIRCYDIVENGNKLQPGDELVVTFSEESVITTPEDGHLGNGIVSNIITSVKVVRNGTTDVSSNYTLVWYPGMLSVTSEPPPL